MSIIYANALFKIFLSIIKSLNKNVLDNWLTW